MQDDDKQYLLRIALEMRLVARARMLDGNTSLSSAEMTEIAERLEWIGKDASDAERERQHLRRVARS